MDSAALAGEGMALAVQPVYWRRLGPGALHRDVCGEGWR